MYSETAVEAAKVLVKETAPSCDARRRVVGCSPRWSLGLAACEVDG